MTEEQKIKRAKELYGNLVYPKTHIELYIDGYLAGAKELENQIADIKANCDLAIEGRDIKIKELEQKNKELEKRLVFARAEFQRQYKENAELKSELTKKADTNHSLVEQMADLESDFRICEHNADTYYDQLTKAKEVIKELLDSYKYVIRFREYVDKKPIAKAEQFLKEIKENE